jgi:hypothetical protein
MRTSFWALAKVKKINIQRYRGKEEIIGENVLVAQTMEELFGLFYFKHLLTSFFAIFTILNNCKGIYWTIH